MFAMKFRKPHLGQREATTVVQKKLRTYFKRFADGTAHERNGKKNVKRMACKARLASARIQWHKMNT